MIATGDRPLVASSWSGSTGDPRSRARASARVVIIPGAGHVPMFDRPYALVAALRTFLNDGA